MNTVKSVSLKQMSVRQSKFFCHPYFYYITNNTNKHKKTLLTLRLCFALLCCSALFLAAMLLLLSKSCMSLKKASSLKRISEISTRRSSPQSFRVRPTNLLRQSWSKRRERQGGWWIYLQLYYWAERFWHGTCNTWSMPPSCLWKNRTNSLLSSFCWVSARTMRRTDVNSWREQTSSMFS